MASRARRKTETFAGYRKNLKKEAMVDKSRSMGNVIYPSMSAGKAFKTTFKGKGSGLTNLSGTVQVAYS